MHVLGTARDIPPQTRDVGHKRPMKTRIEIDGANFASLEEFYAEVSRKLIPEADWGRNLDAFNDVLRGGFGTPEDGFVLVWKNHVEMTTEN